MRRVASDTITSVSLGRGAADDAVPVSVPQLIVAFDCDRPLTAPARHLLDGLDLVTFARGPRAATRRGRSLALSLPDARMSSAHGRLVAEAGGWSLDDPSSKNGCVVNGVLTRKQRLGDGDVIELGHT